MNQPMSGGGMMPQGPNFQRGNARDRKNEQRQREIQKNHELAQVNAQKAQNVDYDDIFSVFDAALHSNANETKAKKLETDVIKREQNKERRRESVHAINMCVQQSLRREMYRTSARTADYTSRIDSHLENRDAVAGSYDDAVVNSRPLPVMADSDTNDMDFEK